MVRSDVERVRAIGRTADLPPQLGEALEPRSFQPLPAPGPHDWLANHPERGQTYEQFVAARSNRPDAVRSRIYFQPIEKFEPGEAPSLDRLRQWAEAFFTIGVSLLAPLQPAAGLITSRQNRYTGQRQLLTHDILSLLEQKIPNDAFCVLAITMSDLYPEETWNFVFGQASLRNRVGVYSFARYDPRFYGKQEAERDRLILRRSCKVLAHETSHMFGIEHCLFYRCAMNGSNHLDESDQRPLHLCPVDLHKLYWAVRFDVRDRYRRLESFCREAGFVDEADWLANMVTTRR